MRLQSNILPSWILIHHFIGRFGNCNSCDVLMRLRQWRVMLLLLLLLIMVLLRLLLLLLMVMMMMMMTLYLLRDEPSGVCHRAINRGTAKLQSFLISMMAVTMANENYSCKINFEFKEAYTSTLQISN